MRILVACEESQAVTKQMRNVGHEAFSCDIEAPGGNRPEWHLQCDVTEVLYEPWDMILAFPPCTHLASSGAAWFAEKRADGRQAQGIAFFRLFTELDCPRVAIENPVGIMSTEWRKPDQIIQPFQFGDAFSKKTCLWLKNLPLLKPTQLVNAGERVTYASGKTMPKWYADAYHLPPHERAKVRSRTFPGIASAMADQWGWPGLAIGAPGVRLAGGNHGLIEKQQA
jgi:hypothetical protein